MNWTEVAELPLAGLKLKSPFQLRMNWNRRR